MEKTHIEKNTVQETLVIPLYGRILCTEQPAAFQAGRRLYEHADHQNGFSCVSNIRVVIWCQFMLS